MKCFDYCFVLDLSSDIKLVSINSSAQRLSHLSCIKSSQALLAYIMLPIIILVHLLGPMMLLLV